MLAASPRVVEDQQSLIRAPLGEGRVAAGVRERLARAHLAALARGPVRGQGYPEPDQRVLAPRRRHRPDHMHLQARGPAPRRFPAGSPEPARKTRAGNRTRREATERQAMGRVCPQVRQARARRGPGGCSRRGSAHGRAASRVGHVSRSVPAGGCPAHRRESLREYIRSESHGRIHREPRGGHERGD